MPESQPRLRAGRSPRPSRSPQPGPSTQTRDQTPQRGRAQLTPDDAYIQAMYGAQARMFVTEGDNAIHTPRLPSPYRRLLAPSPTRRPASAEHSPCQAAQARRATALQRAALWTQELCRRLAAAPGGYTALPARPAKLQKKPSNAPGSPDDT